MKCELINSTINLRHTCCGNYYCLEWFVAMELHEFTKEELYDEFMAANDAYMDMIGKYSYPTYKFIPNHLEIKKRLNDVLEELQRRKQR
jgi:hypothetical protein